MAWFPADSADYFGACALLVIVVVVIAVVTTVVILSTCHIEVLNWNLDVWWVYKS
jgi:hypothetical protein